MSAGQSSDLVALVNELTAESPEFTELWRRYDIRHRRGEWKSFHHPVVGDVTFAYEVLGLGDGQRITLHLAEPGDDACRAASRLCPES